MGGLKNLVSKALNVIKPFVSMVNPLLGAAVGFATNLMQGKNPLQSLLGAATDLIPGGGAFKNTLGKFAGNFLMDGAGGNSLLSGALNLATGQSKVTDVIGDLMKNTAKTGLSQLGMNNAAELSAQRMSQYLLS
ncbi:hypothetical protein [Myxococcus sp. Y35]|uniref:hypothetical protein n=1 Tax=Pseudomyxococcus flavus TaxID=3115648 RepID=UPI003CF71E1E